MTSCSMAQEWQAGRVLLRRRRDGGHAAQERGSPGERQSVSQERGRPHQVMMRKQEARRRGGEQGSRSRSRTAE